MLTNHVLIIISQILAGNRGKVAQEGYLLGNKKYDDVEQTINGAIVALELILNREKKHITNTLS